MLISSLSVTRRTTAEGHTVLRPLGDLDSATITVFRQAVAEVGASEQVVIDMSAAPFLDSCGIGALIGAVRRIRELGGSVVLADARKPVRRVLSLTGIDRIVEVTDTVEAGLESLSAAVADLGSVPVG